MRKLLFLFIVLLLSLLHRTDAAFHDAVSSQYTKIIPKNIRKNICSQKETPVYHPSYFSHASPPKTACAPVLQSYLSSPLHRCATGFILASKRLSSQRTFYYNSFMLINQKMAGVLGDCKVTPTPVPHYTPQLYPTSSSVKKLYAYAYLL